MSQTTVTRATLVELLRWRASSQPERLAYTFLQEDGAEAALTYRELDVKARALAVYLQNQNACGERALLLYQPGLDYIVSFFGCLYAGVSAVPAYPPRQNGNLGRLQAVVADSEASFALTSQPILATIERRFGDSQDLAALNWVVTDKLGEELAEQWEQPAILTCDTLAFLQYTSGSTSAPKGVMLSHGNLLHNLELIQNAFGTTEQSGGVIWLPPYHDMGLIGGILQPLYTGYPMTAMATPVDFITKPLRWLEAISKTGATVSGGPNFAYDLCLQKITPEQRDKLDLSCWVNAFSGAEPIRHETLERFAEYFAPCGFRKEAFYPCYGLAEGTLFVSGGRFEEAPISGTFQAAALERNQVLLGLDEHGNGHTLVSSGRPALMAQTIVIANTDSFTACTEQEVGEIWVSGSSVAQGYWKCPEQTEETFDARLATGEGPFLRTGDLGFIQDGELYVTGRLKDLIIIRGRNYYPQDIEFTVRESHPAVGNNNGAAFSIDVDGEERLVIVFELERQFRKANHAEVAKSIREAVSEQYQLQLYALVLIKPASIPKTSSGKIQRHACRERFLSETLDVIYTSLGQGTAVPEDAAAGDADALSEGLTLDALHALPEEERLAALTAHLRRKTAEVLKISPAQVRPEQSLSMIGLDSLMVVELKNGIEDSFAVDVPFARFLEGPTLAEMASNVLEEVKEFSHGSVSMGSVAVYAEREFPLSHGQRALWFLQRLEPDSAVYNISRAVRIKGVLDVEALRSAFEQVTERHSILRTTFGLQGGEPVQRVQEQAGLFFHVQEAQSLPEEELKFQLQENALRPFDLEQGTLFRVNVYERSAMESVLQLTFHHIIVDFWSLSVLIDELWTIYDGLRKGAQVVLSPLETGYGDYVRWQSEWMAGAKGVRHFDYWSEQLAGAQTVLNLPTDRPRPSVQTYHGSSQAFRLSPELTRRVKAFVKERGVTLYVLLMAAYQVLLHRYSGQSDILVGSPTASRGSAQFADVAGYFINPVVVKGTFAETQTFAEFLDGMRRTVLGALDHQEYPFSLLVERLKPQRDPSYSPLFQVMFSWQKSHLEAEGMTGLALGAPGTKLTAAGLEMEALDWEAQVSQMDLWLTMGEVNGHLNGDLEYNTDLFDRETIERLTSHFQTLLGGMVQDPECPIAKLPLLSEPQCRQMLVEWNDTDTAGKSACIHQLFEEQVARTPDQIAVVFEDRQLTYAELNKRSNQLAHRLQKQGVGPEVLVGLCMERSLEMMVGLLGILKAGGAYVPLDPTYPSDRLAFILEDAQAAMLLTQSHLLGKLPAHAAEVLALGPDWTSIAQESEDNPAGDVQPENVAYMIYTSGSTGKPKGVMIEHRHAVNFFAGMDQRIGCKAEDTLLAVTSICFDISVLELFYTLVRGAKIILLSEQEASGGLAHTQAKQSVNDDKNYSLGAQAKAHQATLLQCTPSLMKIMSADPNKLAALRSLQTLMLGGEALSVKQAEQLRNDLPNTRLVNMYGPTEATVWATTHEVRAVDGSVPIGRPFANVKTYVLDTDLQPVPVGLPGELHIGGRGVARGYHRRPELTAEKFIDDPFSNESYARLYKTGDLVQYLPDGNIKFLGRIDNQVKIRGFRIELGEIEKVLMQHVSVREAVVFDREDTPGDKYLAAYAVSADGQVPANHELRDFLQETLPEYMIPSAFVFVDHLPLTPNGKLDRKALPNPKNLRSNLKAAYVEPQSELEQQISNIWKEVLCMNKVGVHDNFFEIGGHSLQIVQVHTRLKESLNVEIPVVQLFQYPTVSALATHLSQGESEMSLSEKGRNRAENRRDLAKQRRQSRRERSTDK